MSVSIRHDSNRIIVTTFFSRVKEYRISQTNQLMAWIDDKLPERNMNLLLQTIDETLVSIFGKKTTCVVFDFLKKEFALEKNQIPAKPRLFSQGLYLLFGSASHLIEQRILRNLSVKSGVGLDPENDVDFADYVVIHETMVEIK
jgi:hypothetical protein